MKNIMFSAENWCQMASRNNDLGQMTVHKPLKSKKIIIIVIDSKP